MRHLLAIFALTSICWATQASALEPAAPWPQQAQSRPLPRPSWIMVVPARRLPDGTLTVWDRADPWTKAWRVPRTIQGLRTVSLLGDTEDRRSITAAAIDGMLVDSLDVVMRKYGAPAIALAVTDGQSVAMAAWVPGWSASWEPVQVGSSVEETRERALSTLSGMLKTGVARPRSPDAGAEASIDAFRPKAGGGNEYRVTIRSQTALQDALSALTRIRGASVGVEARDASTATVVIGLDPGSPGLEQELAALGFVVR